ncbi:hypothetical protein HPP92_009017 [Vanilla planifolia]|uniref:Uncharacterized protein n=1 Tax=Vanilla planifolia TaxID=51239 RepID=A0A835V680_VANPL|nr:hypothetical protein HPP92_009017 [Vanilla planifolia]
MAMMHPRRHRKQLSVAQHIWLGSGAARKSDGVVSRGSRREIARCLADCVKDVMHENFDVRPLVNRK